MDLAQQLAKLEEGGSRPYQTDERVHLTVVDVANVLVDIVHARVEQ